jgi:hypothetical protein
MSITFDFIQNHNELGFIDIGNTHLVGYIQCTYEDLVHLFGNPLEDGFDNYKSDAEWHLQLADGRIATIYNYKNGKNYCGALGMDAKDITKWHVGSKNASVIADIIFYSNKRIRSISSDEVYY